MNMDGSASPELEPPPFEEVNLLSNSGGDHSSPDDKDNPEDVSIAQEIDTTSPDIVESSSDEPICNDEKAGNLLSDETETPDSLQATELPSSHEINTPAFSFSDGTTEISSIKDESVQQTADLVKETTSSDTVLPSPHEVSAPISDVPSSHPVVFERTESIKENPFNRMTTSKNDVVDSNENINDHVSEEVPKIEDVEVTKPMDKSKDQKSPMVVSVGTIEVNGSDQYEDINIMSKGSSEKEEAPKPSENTEGEENVKDYESLRDLRFSSISIYDKPHFEEDIIITVDDAQKHAAESFVSYKVVTKTTRESFLQHEFHVRRRYQDFLWLSNIMVQHYPSNIIPPLPQKKIFNKYDPSFLRLRQLALNKFLCRIAEHPILSASEHFFTFLSAKQVELIEQKKTTALKKFTIPQLPIANVESPFTSTSEYIEEFGKVLSTLSSQSAKLDKEQTELENALKALSPSLALWANSEVCFSSCNFLRL